MRRASIALVAMIGLVIAACGGDATSSTTTSGPTSTTTAPAPTTTQSEPTNTTTPPPATTSTTVDGTSTTTPAATTTTLRGTPIDFGPAEGDVLMVIGVRHDDVLNLRANPGADQTIRDEIPPTFTGLVAQGETRDLGDAFWIQVEYEGTIGWVHMGYIGYGGDVTDDTSVVTDELGERPVEPTMAELGELVASVYASTEEPESDVVQVTPATSGDLAEVTYDVIGFGDDAVRGVRIHVFAEETEDGFSLRSVETTLICGRGVDDGACV